ncbi:hypothetical protein PspLS_05858 [Pyricularia sp. CBS 133598]|nr:hypothetical protein PspLS_05858 [Pyricularia sp. CBS 133598]
MALTNSDSLLLDFDLFPLFFTPLRRLISLVVLRRAGNIGLFRVPNASNINIIVINLISVIRRREVRGINDIDRIADDVLGQGIVVAELVVDTLRKVARWERDISSHHDALCREQRLFLLLLSRRRRPRGRVGV